MTNATIIFNESMRLMDEGVIKPSNITAIMVDENGDEKEINLPEDIHTYNGWKQAGRQVRKGQKAIASFPIWKMCKGKKAVEDEEEDNRKMYMCNAYWFTLEQTDAIG